MCRTAKVVLLGVYCAIFLLCLKYLIFYKKQDIIDIHYILKTPGALKKMLRGIKKRKNGRTVLTPNFRRPIRFPTDLKFILQWNDIFSHPYDTYKYGQKAFIENNCSYYNCFITNIQNVLVDLRYFDAIIFDAGTDWDKHPPLRAPYQTYIFTAMQYSNFDQYCSPYNYNNYFNLTWTYRLDSNITRSPIEILDKNGHVIGPRTNMSWIESMKPTPEDVKNKIRNKKKAVAWFLYDCYTKKSSKKQKFASYLEIILTEANLTLDVYGWCGNLKCPKHRIEECLLLLRRDYYFYLAFEMMSREDYVTEEILHPLQNYAVPIVHGGANYSRFLPPGSYIDAVKLSGDEVVSLIVQAIKSPETYQNYFRWHNHYSYRKASKEIGICNVCEALNVPARNSSIRNFNRWWYADNLKPCIDQSVILKGS